MGCIYLAKWNECGFQNLNVHIFVQPTDIQCPLILFDPDAKCQVRRQTMKRSDNQDAHMAAGCGEADPRT
jgi:hypothetical protein